jgi:hypothetical protein
MKVFLWIVALLLILIVGACVYAFSLPENTVRTLGDEAGPFSGSWTYAITPAASGSEVSITEKSRMKNPLFRLMTKIFGETKYLDEHLEDIGKHFGETVTVR